MVALANEKYDDPNVFHIITIEGGDYDEEKDIWRFTLLLTTFRLPSEAGPSSVEYDNEDIISNTPSECIQLIKMGVLQANRQIGRQAFKYDIPDWMFGLALRHG